MPQAKEPVSKLFKNFIKEGDVKEMRGGREANGIYRGSGARAGDDVSGDVG